VLRPAERLQVDVFHLPLAEEIRAPARERLEHLDMNERGAGGAGAQLGQGWTEDEDVLLPGDGVAELRDNGLDGAEGLFPFRDAVRTVVVRIASDRIEEEEVPAVALAVTHPERRLVRALGGAGSQRLVELDHLKELARGGLDQARLVEKSRPARDGRRSSHAERQPETRQEMHGT